LLPTKKIIGWTVLLGIVGAAAMFAPAPAPEPVAVPTVRPQAANEGPRVQASASSWSDALPAREQLGQSRGDVFGARSWSPPARPAAAASGPTTPVIITPAAPPVPYRVAGQVMHDGGAHIVLARGDAVQIVRVGETLEGGYRVEAIRSDRVTLLYEPLGVRSDLPVPGTELAQAQPASTPVPAPLAQAVPAPSAAPAQLRWEGPERVQAGTPFNVALKVTSGEALRAAPLQLSFDAALLEPVSVRAGRYFADGTFSYRVNPAGSIFIGASGKGSAAADAEILVVSFKAIRPGATELKLSSVLLQGDAGRAITHAQPAAFRTSITQ
jgi:hypothetical protein